MSGLRELRDALGRQYSSEFGDALGGRDQVEHRYALGSCDRANLEIHFDAGIV